MCRYFLSEVAAGAGVEDAAVATAGVDELSELELGDVLLLSPDDFGLALP